MKPHQPNSSSRGQNMAHQARNMQRGADDRYYPVFSITWFLDKLLSGLYRLFVALKHQLYKVSIGRFEGMRLPWFKLGLAAFILFMMTKKDLQFSINMKAPLRTASMEAAQATGVALRADEMSLGQSILSKFKGSKSTTSLESLDVDQVKAYIKRFSRVAIAEMQKYDIPASIKLGQAILESQAGNAATATEDNNHFGAPLAGKAYANAWENWRAHSLLLRESLPEAQEAGRSYKKWAKALKSYSNDRSYSDKLLEVIEAYQLYQLDEEL